MDGRRREDIRPGMRVEIVLKKDQRTGRRTAGVVRDLLTSAAHHSRGIKVRLADGQVGRVQAILAPEAPSTPILHLTSGDIAGGKLTRSGVPGEVLVWHDLLYDGPRRPGWPEEETLRARAVFLEGATGGGLGREAVLATLRAQYQRLGAVGGGDRVVLWFDACLFDQAMLCHLLACLHLRGARGVELLCVDSFPGIEPYHGLGQLAPEDFAAIYGRRRPVSGEQFRFAAEADRAFALQEEAALAALSARASAPLPWVAAAAARWLEERPSGPLGLGKLERLALDAVRAGCETPAGILAAVAAGDAPPRFWGDITLWARINGLADRRPPLVAIEGPKPRLPQWDGLDDLTRFRVRPAAAGLHPPEAPTSRPGAAP